MGFGAIFLFRKPPDLDRAIKEFHRSLELAPNEVTIMATLVRALVIKRRRQRSGINAHQTGENCACL